MNPDVVYDYPSWASGFAIVLLTVVAGMIAQAVLHAVLPSGLRNDHSIPVTAIFAVIGTTYAVLLAFVAMLTWEEFNKARAATFDEAGAVAELRRLSFALPASTADGLRTALDTYVRNVVEVEWPAQARGKIDTRAELALETMHVAIGQMHLDTPEQSSVEAQFLSQLSTLNAARQVRLQAVRPTVPTVVWVVLLVGGGLLVTFSALLGAPSYPLHLLMTGALCASGALVIVLIVSLDSPFRSDFGIEPSAFSMRSSVPAAR